MHLESLESRNLLAIVVGLTGTNELATFASDAPEALLSTVAVSGLDVGENLVGIDYRPADGLLYGVGSASNLYTLDYETGVATFVSELTVGGNPFALTGTEFGVDFNPVADRLRITSDADVNLRINVDTGETTVDTTLAYNVGDSNEGADPAATAAGYTNSFAGSTATTLYAIDTDLDILVQQNPPNNGTLLTIGSLGVDATAVNGFDILPGGNVAVAALTVANVTSLYSIDLQTGVATALGTIDATGATPLRGIAAVPESAAAGVAISVNVANELLQFDPANPAVITSTTAITGLAATEVILGIDFRPANGLLYAVGSLGNLYTIDIATAVATDVADLNDGVNSLVPIGNSFGVDFNPVVDRLRITSDAGINWRVDVGTGLAIPDTELAYLPGDENEGATPAVSASAYTNSESGAQATQLYGIDTELDILVLQDPANDGALATVGELGVDVLAVSGFDIRPGENEALATLTTVDGTLLYRIDLTSGVATPLAPVGDGDIELGGLAIVTAADAQPGSLQFSAPTYTINEGQPSIEITVTRTGGADGTITVDYTTSDGTATAGSDYTVTSGTLTFLDGETSKTFTIPILADTDDEADETANLTLTNVTGGGTLGTLDEAVLTVVDDDGVTPPATDNANFVANLYADVLDRALDVDGAAFWLSQLEAGATRQAVALGFVSSGEFYKNQVNDIYQDLLGRAADADGLQYWLQQLSNGATADDVIAGVISSEEYYSGVNTGTNQAFVDAIYLDLLGRAASSDESTAAVGRLDAATTTRSQLALELVVGAEYRGLLVDDATELTGDLETDGPSQAWYQDFLERNADAEGKQFYTDTLVNGGSRADVQAVILASDEFFAKLA